MKKLALAVLLGGLLALAGCADKGVPTPTPRADADFERVVSVTGELVPARWATVSAKIGGRVVEVLVEPGASVREGIALVRLDTADSELALHAAQQEVIAQQAALDQLLAGSSQPMIERADRENAQQIEQAEVALRIQERQLEQARARDPSKDVAAAQAQVDQLLAQVAQVQAQSPQAQVRIAEIELERAQIALDDVQDEYQQALDRPWETQKVRDALAKALEQAQLSHRAAQAQLDDTRGMLQAHTASLRVLAAQVTAARIRLEQAQEAQRANRLALAILEDEVESARLALAHLRAWENPYRDPARAQEIEQVEARLEQARGAVAQIEQQIQDATLVSPLEGTVGLVSVRAGEQVVPTQSLVIVGDLDTLRVETTDLDEIDVVRVSVGQTATVVFDALPDRVLEGYVTRISPMAEPGSGGVHYTVVLELAEVDPSLRWGMTAFVDINVGDD